MDFYVLRNDPSSWKMMKKGKNKSDREKIKKRWGETGGEKKTSEDLDISELEKRSLVSKGKLRNKVYFSIFKNICNSAVEVRWLKSGNRV